MGRDVAWRALLEWGAPPKTVRLVPDMHQHTTCSLCTPGSGLGKCNWKRGAAWGCDCIYAVQSVHGLCRERYLVYNLQWRNQDPANVIGRLDNTHLILGLEMCASQHLHHHHHRHHERRNQDPAVLRLGDGRLAETVLGL